MKFFLNVKKIQKILNFKKGRKFSCQDYENAIKKKIQSLSTMLYIDRKIIRMAASIVRKKEASLRNQKLPQSKGWLDKFMKRNKQYIDNLNKSFEAKNNGQMTDV